MDMHQHDPARLPQATAAPVAPAWSAAGTLGRYGSLAFDLDVKALLAPLIGQWQTYDTARLQLEQQGGTLYDLSAITALLKARVHITDRGAQHTVALAEQASLHAMLGEIGHGDLLLDVRQRHTHMPVYYLCRVRQDYWHEYSLIVEDLYLSPGYPLTDTRFVKLMHAGHDTYFLRLSPFREPVTALVQDDAGAGPGAVDTLLYTVGRHVLQAAWHEDQRPGVLVATHGDLPCFHQAIELLYLCLSGDLCELRSAITPTMRRFFTQVYPQPAIHALLLQLQQLDGSALNALPQQALPLYVRLSQAFNRFLEVEIPWGHRQLQVPLAKLLWGNVSRLELVGSALKDHAAVREAGARLEAVAQEVIERVLRNGEAEEGGGE
jgi:hypothetical protein